MRTHRNVLKRLFQQERKVHWVVHHMVDVGVLACQNVAGGLCHCLSDGLDCVLGFYVLTDGK